MRSYDKFVSRYTYIIYSGEGSKGSSGGRITVNDTEMTLLMNYRQT